MQKNPFTNFHIRQNHPDFLDLPWYECLSEWSKQSLTNRLIEVERGNSRHDVVFVTYDTKIYAIKELPPKLAQLEYTILRELEKHEMPAVKAVGFGVLGKKGSTEERSTIITEYLEASLPYRILFMKSGLEKYRNSLLDALAVLFVRLHLNGFFWGDCSLSNILFRRDANELQAYLVDAETSKYYPGLLSEGHRNHDIAIAQENVCGELMDLSKLVDLPDTLDIYEIGDIIKSKYNNLWKEITKEEVFNKNETYRIQDRIKRLNSLGFSVDEIELISTDEGNQVRMKTIVTDKNYHQDTLHNLTGIMTEEAQARIILNEINELRIILSDKEDRKFTIKQYSFLLDL
jgi:tRNA A-37 threonylcarbamoyl transferase component Bud32/DNA-binding transcriptional MerR regulator